MWCSYIVLSVNEVDGDVDLQKRKKKRLLSLMLPANQGEKVISILVSFINK